MTVSVAGAQLIGTKGALQISFAYSAIVRSEENQPTLAVLRTLARSCSTRSRSGAHGAITLACLEWTGESEPVLVVDWAVIRNVA